MNEVLDNFEEKKIKDYAKRSFRQFIIALVCLSITTGVFCFIVMPKLEQRLMTPNPIFVIAFFSFLISTINGLINALKSYRAKEQPSKMKQVALIGNTLFFFLIIGYFIYSYEIMQKVLIAPIEKVESVD